jgi:hypothetical protein
MALQRLAEARAASLAGETVARHHDAPAEPNDDLRAALEGAITLLPPRRREVFSAARRA